jgi:hypothetical protein
VETDARRLERWRTWRLSGSDRRGAPAVSPAPSWECLVLRGGGPRGLRLLAVVLRLGPGRPTWDLDSASNRAVGRSCWGAFRQSVWERRGSAVSLSSAFQAIAGIGVLSYNRKFEGVGFEPRRVNARWTNSTSGTHSAAPSGKAGRGIHSPACPFGDRLFGVAPRPGSSQGCSRGRVYFFITRPRLRLPRRQLELDHRVRCRPRVHEVEVV